VAGRAWHGLQRHAAGSDETGFVIIAVIFADPSGNASGLKFSVLPNASAGQFVSRRWSRQSLRC
jgi:hypothetical protein